MHIVSFDVPWPADYGGVIDVYYKAKALSGLGVQVHLHSFSYGRGRSAELEKAFHRVHYYPRHTKKRYLFSNLPYIAVSRQDPELLRNLSEDDHPVLFEGLHSCLYLSDQGLSEKKKMVRTHNVEHEYYEALGKVERNAFKKLYFMREAKKLRSFESVLKSADRIFAISEPDRHHFMKTFSNVSCLPPFHPFSNISIPDHTEPFALYHGNMRVGENDAAAMFLIREVFNDLPVRLVIAGNKCSSSLKKEAAGKGNVEIREHVDQVSLLRLIHSAHINVLPTFQATGIKLKLLTALYNGNHCLVNTKMVMNTGLESLCSVKDSAGEMKEEVLRLMGKRLRDTDRQMRAIVLEEKFSASRSAAMLLESLARAQ